MSDVKILMCSIPDGDRGPAIGYKRHMASLKDAEGISITEISEEILKDKTSMSQFDVFWFYVRFDPRLYNYIYQNFSKKIFWVGPNVLLEKAEIGPSDPWEKYFVDNIKTDLYSNVAQYYLDRVGQFYTGSSCMVELPYCIDAQEYEIFEKNKNLVDRAIDVLVYSKKRRIDKQFENLYPRFIDNLEKSGLEYEVIEYGSHTREQFLSMTADSKCCVWFSIEDYCSNAQLEAMLMGCPIVGTKYNLTHTFDESFLVDGQNMSTSNWITWKDEIPALYMKGTQKVLKNLKNINEKPRQYVIDNHGPKAYSSKVRTILSSVVSK